MMTKQFSWTPTAAGDYPITIQATDGLGQTTTKNIMIHVTQPLPPLPTLAVGILALIGLVCIYLAAWLKKRL